LEASQRLVVVEDVPLIGLVRVGRIRILVLQVTMEVAVVVPVYLTLQPGLEVQEQQAKDVMAVQMVQITILEEVVEVQAQQVAVRIQTATMLIPGMVAQA
jgi:hypothetical protein